MTGKVVDILKNGNLIVPKLLFNNYKRLEIKDDELILLIYLMNYNEFDPEKIASNLGLKATEVLTLINSLSKKDILKLERISVNNVCEEVICLDELYNKLVLFLMETEEKRSDVTLFDKFEKEFGRTLSPMEYEIIGAWVDSDFTEELILLALKEAIYNGVANLRYIDKILYEWRKKGVVSSSDVENIKPKRKEPVKEVIEDYDWLNE